MSRPHPRVARLDRMSERGSAMLVVSTILTALLAGGGIALYLQLQSTKSAGLTKSNRSSLYCAEAGMTAEQAALTNQFALWNSLIDADGTNDPAWYPLRGDLDGDGVADYEVRIKDNDDETSPTANNPAVDIDSRVFMMSRCLQNPEVPRTVMQLIDVAASGHNYRNQSGGGAGNTGNQN